MFRLDQEKEDCSFYFWLTLQYDPEHVPRMPSGDMCFSKEHCRLFFEHIRIKYRENDITFKHFLVSEYGGNGTKRPHYHCLLMVYLPEWMSDITTLYNTRIEMRDYLIHQAWKYGHVTEKAFHGRVLRYLTKYCCKPEIVGDYHEMAPFTLISRGIGLGLLDKLGEKRLQQMRETMDFTLRYGSGKMQLPRYYTEKILPHSTDALRKAILKHDPGSGLNEGYSEIMNNRIRFKRQQQRMGFNYLRHVENDFPDTYAYLRKVASDRSLAFDEFKVKMKQRKDL